MCNYSIIVNLPHISEHMPDWAQSIIMLPDYLLDSAIKCTTDFYADELFAFSNATVVKGTCSRLLCDLSRVCLGYKDKTADKTFPVHLNGRVFRSESISNSEVLQKLFDVVYFPYQQEILKKLNSSCLFNTKLLVNCGYFTNGWTTLYTQNFVPDVIIFMSKEKTPRGLVEGLKASFKNFDFSVSIIENSDEVYVPEGYEAKGTNFGVVTLLINSETVLCQNMNGIYKSSVFTQMQLACYMALSYCNQYALCFHK